MNKKKTGDSLESIGEAKFSGLLQTNSFKLEEI